MTRDRISLPTVMVLCTTVAAVAVVLTWAPEDSRTWLLSVLALVAPVLLAWMRGLGHGAHVSPEEVEAEIEERRRQGGER